MLQKYKPSVRDKYKALTNEAIKAEAKRLDKETKKAKKAKVAKNKKKNESK